MRHGSKSSRFKGSSPSSAGGRKVSAFFGATSPKEATALLGGSNSRHTATMTQLATLPLGSLNWLLRDEGAAAPRGGSYGTPSRPPWDGGGGGTASGSGAARPWRPGELPLPLTVSAFLPEADRASLACVSPSLAAVVETSNTSLAKRRGSGVTTPKDAAKRRASPAALPRRGTAGRRGSNSSATPLSSPMPPPPRLGMRSVSGDVASARRPRPSAVSFFWLSTDLKDDLGPGGPSRPQGAGLKKHGFRGEAGTFSYLGGGGGGGGSGGKGSNGLPPWQETVREAFNRWQITVPAAILAVGVLATALNLFLGLSWLWWVAAALFVAAAAVWGVSTQLHASAAPEEAAGLSSRNHGLPEP